MLEVKNLYVKTPNYLKEDGTIDEDAYGDGDDFYTNIR